MNNDILIRNGSLPFPKYQDLESFLGVYPQYNHLSYEEKNQYLHFANYINVTLRFLTGNHCHCHYHYHCHCHCHYDCHCHYHYHYTTTTTTITINRTTTTTTTILLLLSTTTTNPNCKVQTMKSI